MLAAITALVLLTSCGFLCNDAACHAAGRPSSASSITNGIAGVVVSASDAISKGCGECEFSSTTISIWRTPNAIVDKAGAEAMVANRPPDLTVAADRRYEQALVPGSYLMCTAGPCLPLTIGANEVHTVNVVLSVGTFFRVWAPSAEQETTVNEFHIGWR